MGERVRVPGRWCVCACKEKEDASPCDGIPDIFLIELEYGCDSAHDIPDPWNLHLVCCLINSLIKLLPEVVGNYHEVFNVAKDGVDIVFWQDGFQFKLLVA